MTQRSLSGLDACDIAEVLAGTRSLRGRLRNARIVVTGATGWFGTWLLDALVACNRADGLGLSIVAISRRPARFAERHPLLYAAPEIEWMAADVRDATLAVTGSVTHVIHAATEASAALNAAEPDLMFDTIVRGTRNALRLAADHPGSRILLIGSGATYGSSTEIRRWSENDRNAPDPLDAGNAYAEGKRAAEQLAAIWQAARGVDVLLARCFAFVGPHMPFDAHFAIGNFIRDALDSDRIRIVGDGLPMRSYLYMTDLTIWLLTILVEGVSLRPYNVGAERAVSIRELAALCAAAGDHRAEVVVAGSAASGRHYLPDTSRARTELGLTVRVPLEDAIVRTTAWRRLHVDATATA